MKNLVLAFGILVAASSASLAEVVDVKYRGPVPLDAFTCPALKKSSLVSRICYDASEQYLIVQLRKTYYHYCMLPTIVFDEWLAAPSLGKFYTAEIKGAYDCREATPPVY